MALLDRVDPYQELLGEFAVSLTIKAGAFYRTRAGKKAWVGAINCPSFSSETLGWIEGEHTPSSWGPGGRVDDDRPDVRDLVSEWREPIKGEAWALVDQDDEIALCGSSKNGVLNFLSGDQRAVRIRYEEIPGDEQ